MNRFLIICALAFLLLPTAAFAENKDLDERTTDPNYAGAIRDSVYYTLDDGIMTEDEMKDEAEYVHQQCLSNPLSKVMFDCDCLAGTFLIRREKLGPTIPQTSIVRDMTESAKGVCPNTLQIAADGYSTCMEIRDIHHNLDGFDQNNAVCECAANYAARAFTKKPILDVTYSMALTMDGITYCEDPQNRVKKKAPETVTPTGSLVPPKN